MTCKETGQCKRAAACFVSGKCLDTGVAFGPSEVTQGPRHIDMLGGEFTNDQLVEYYQAYQPTGSGPLSTMRVICALIEQLARDRGIDLPPAKGIK